MFPPGAAFGVLRGPDQGARGRGATGRCDLQHLRLGAPDGPAGGLVSEGRGAAGCWVPGLGDLGWVESPNIMRS